MQSKKRRAPMDEVIAGVIGVLMVAVFLGFMAIDIGDTPLLIITAIVLAMAVTDLVQTVRGRDNGSQ